MKYLILVFTVLLLSSCANFKKMICDCEPEIIYVEDTKSSKYATKLKPKKAKTSAAAKAAPEKKQTTNAAKDEVLPDANRVELTPEEKQDEELEMLASVTEAMDAFLFKKEEDKFFKVCQDPHLDCYLNNKYYPKGKKKVRRKAPPTMTGSKLGSGEPKGTQLRYEFFSN
ncbi:MAG: hypothetical protein ACLGGX_12030 [Bdellovibrionia bacterium]